MPPDCYAVAGKSETKRLWVQCKAHTLPKPLIIRGLYASCLSRPTSLKPVQIGFMGRSQGYYGCPQVQAWRRQELGYTLTCFRVSKPCYVRSFLAFRGEEKRPSLSLSRPAVKTTHRRGKRDELKPAETILGYTCFNTILCFNILHLDIEVHWSWLWKWSS